MKGVFFETYGCQMNQLDSELMLGALTGVGYHEVPRPADADLVLLNTCSVREHAEDKVHSFLGTLAKEKSRRPDLVIGVVGCMAQSQSERLLSRYPHVDLVVGPSQIDHLTTFLARVADRAGVVGRGVRIRETEHKPVRFERNIGARPSPHAAFVEIIRGCDVRCTFCVVPTTRGPEVSRSPEEVLAEVRALAEDGVKEVTLLGQTVDHYGRNGRGGYGLGHLLVDVAKIPEIVRVRFITSHPRYLDDSIVDAIATTEKVCPYIHMPLQSGSDRILAAMKRKYDLARYRDRVRAIRRRIPEAAIASDFIVGFPGETEEDFQASCKAIQEFRFTNSFIFKYSPRPGTPASLLPDDVSLEAKKSRNQILLEITNRIRTEELASFVGRTIEVLVEGVSKRDPSNYTGRTRTNQIVCFPSSPARVGERVDIRITGHTTLTLFGVEVGGLPG